MDREGSQPARSVPKLMAAAWETATTDPDPLAALGATRALAEMLSSWEARLATEAMDSGATWSSIGSSFGISRQAAWERLHQDVQEFKRQFKQNARDLVQHDVQELKRQIKQDARELAEQHREEVLALREEIKSRAREARRRR